MANGITFGKSKDILYVADTLDRSVTKLKRDPKTNYLQKINIVKVGYLLDNLRYDHLTDSVFTGVLADIKDVSKLVHPMPERVHIDGVKSMII